MTDPFEQLLASYASFPSRSKGRLVPEEASVARNPFQRDKDRILHSAAFRRLREKTQVFVAHEGDHFRTRLTHSLEVSQIARSLARALHVQEDLAEAVALAHDLGHPPFAHGGEDVLQECLHDFGGFNHNDQSLRIVTKLEARYAEFDGLNLSWETLEGLAKHNGPVTKRPLPPTIAILDKQVDLQLSSYAGLEAQLANLSDDIAYNNHDIDDGLRAGYFTIDDLCDLPLVGLIAQEVNTKYPGLGRVRAANEIIRRMMGLMVSDVLSETQRRMDSLKPQTADNVRCAPEPMVAFSHDMQPQITELRRFLFQNLYGSERVQVVRREMAIIIRDLFNTFFHHPDRMPKEWQERLKSEGEGRTPTARIVLDYIAGMTDRYAIKEHGKLLAAGRIEGLPKA